MPDNHPLACGIVSFAVKLGQVNEGIYDCCMRGAVTRFNNDTLGTGDPEKKDGVGRTSTATLHFP